MSKAKMEASKPLVSVILPFYNAPHLSEAVESILHQTYQNIELILINNGSNDGSEELATTYLSDSRVILLEEPVRGVVHAANKGIQRAAGKYVARMDADDYSFPNRIALQLEEFKKDPELQMVSGLVAYSGKEENEGFITYVKWLNSIRTTEEIKLNQFVEFPLANPSIMFRQEVFEKYGYYEDGDFPEDYEFFLRLLSYGVKGKKVKEIILKWRDSELRLTRTDERYSHESFYRVKARYLAEWLVSNNRFHPQILVWGAGRVSRRRSDLLLKEGITISGYIDLKASKNVLHYESIPGPEECFIVSYVSSRGIRDEIRSFLVDRGFVEGVNFILAA